MKNKVIVMDNVPFHKRRDIVDMIATAGHTVMFLPPYAPQLNPIEEVFSVWKGKIKAQNCTSEEELMNAIQSGSAIISRKH